MDNSIMKNFRDLNYQKKILIKFAKKLPKKEETMVKDALDIAEAAHAGQYRDEGDPYIIHPIRVTNTLHRQLGVTDSALIVAALLHDVIEDSDYTTLDYIKEKFGDEKYELVKNLTRERPDNETEAHKKIWKSKKLKEYFSYDADTRLIKCSDFLDNIRSWTLIPKTSPTIKKFPRWLEETEKYYLPLARKTNDYLAEQISQEFEIAKIITALHRL